jgi:hypothetical protein
MVLSDVLPRIHADWRADYVQFVETGEASDDLLAYLDGHENCCELIEFVFADPAEPEPPAQVPEEALSGHFVRPITNGA